MLYIYVQQVLIRFANLNFKQINKNANSKKKLFVKYYKQDIYHKVLCSQKSLYNVQTFPYQWIDDFYFHLIFLQVMRVLFVFSKLRVLLECKEMIKNSWNAAQYSLLRVFCLISCTGVRRFPYIDSLSIQQQNIKKTLGIA